MNSEQKLFHEALIFYAGLVLQQHELKTSLINKSASDTEITEKMKDINLRVNEAKRFLDGLNRKKVN